MQIDSERQSHRAVLSFRGSHGPARCLLAQTGESGSALLMTPLEHTRSARLGKGRPVSDEPRAVSVEWRDRQPLTGTELTDFLALRHVCGRPGSRVAALGDYYIQNERPLLPFIADGLTALIDVGHLTLGEPGPASCGIRPVTVTASGRARYEDLCDRQGIAPYPRCASAETSDE